jgi:hypothetical protein
MLSSLRRGTPMKLLAVILSLIGTAAPATVHDAALLHMRGDFAAARAEIEAVLAEQPSDAPALFTAACFALESSNPNSATPYVSRLEQLSAPPPQVRVLTALISRRERQREERIDDAVVEAWKEAGRPDLTAIPLLPPLESFGDVLPELEASVRARMTPAERLLFAYEGPVTGEAYRKLAFQAAATAEKNPLCVNIEILAAFTPHEPMPLELRAEAHRIAVRLAPIVAASDRANGYLDVAGWLPSDSGDVPMCSGDLVLLERAVAKPRFEVPRREMLAEMQNMASRLDARYGAIRASRAALGTSVPLMRLWQRAEATEEPALRRRAGDLLTAMAKRLGSSGTMLERMLGLALAEKGAKLSGDERRIAVVRTEVSRGRASMNAMRADQKRLGTWPFAGPWRDWDPTREMEHFQRFVQ